MLQTVAGVCEGIPWTARRRRPTKTGWPKNDLRRMTVPTWEVFVNGHQLGVVDMANVSASEEEVALVAMLNAELLRRWSEWG